jgi:peptide/nickel transport system substrate-binding protein
MLNRRTFLASSATASFFSYAGLSAAFADTPKGILVVAQQLDNMTSLDPHESFEAVGSEISSNCYQKLVKANLDKPSEVVGDLAESWEVGADGKTVTFRLRKDATFASGQPVTAEDAAFSLQRAVIMNKGPAFIINQFGFTKDNAAERIKATDANTLALTLQEPTSPSFLLYCLSANVGSVVEKKVTLEKAQSDDLGNGWLRQNTAGSGAWVLRSWKPSESIMLDANPNGSYKGNIKRIILRHIVDPSAQLLMLQKGDADVARNLTTEQLRTLKGDANYNLVQSGVASLMVVSMNQKTPNLAKPQVWQAIKWALDYEGVQKNIVPLTHVVH